MPPLRDHLDTATGSERGLSSPQQCSNAEAAPKTGETLDISRVAADWKVRAPGQKKDWRPACAGRQKPNPRSRSALGQRHSAFQQTIGEPFRLHHDGEGGGHTRNPGLSGLRMFAWR